MSKRTPRERQMLALAVVALLLATAMTAIMARRWAAIPETPDMPIRIELPDFSLIDQSGRTVSLRDLAGAPWIADFIFTRCAGTCPLMTQEMKRLGESLPADQRVRRVSFSVDPGYDTPEVLAAYARLHGVADQEWLFLTGDRDAIYRLSIEGFKLPVDADPAAGAVEADEPIVHSTRFVLVDAAGVIRGYYDAFDPEGPAALLEDLEAVLDPADQGTP